MDYLYELRERGAIVATGRLTTENELGVGSDLVLAGVPVRVRAVIPGLAGESPRLILEPVADPSSRPAAPPEGPT